MRNSSAARSSSNHRWLFTFLRSAPITRSGRLPDETETHLFRIAQEALTNVARHAGAKRVEVKLESGGGEIRLTIHDDGRGLAAAPAPEAGRARGQARSV